jgi:hypothetical protein
MKIFPFLRLTLSLGMLLLLVPDASAQKEESDNPYAGLPFKDRIFIGGDFGLSFGAFTYIRIAPMLGYNVNERLAVGAGPSYQYFSDNRFTPKFTSSIYGGGTFARYFIFESVFLQADLEILNLEERFPRIDPNGEFFRDRVTIPVLFLGGGYSQRVGSSGFFIGIFYDVIGDPNSPYPDNVALRLGGFIGL